jgi:hypothetical protein
MILISTYEIPSKDLLKHLKNYANKKEDILVSSKLEYKDKLYREVVFNKKSLINNETKGIMYIDENFTTVKDDNLIKELASLAYYYEVFYGNRTENSIFNAINHSGGLNREKNDLKLAEKGLDYIYDAGLNEAQYVKDIINKIPNIRDKNNCKLIELKDIVDKFSFQEAFNNDILNSIYNYYEEILALNFENITTIASGIDYYDNIQNAAKKSRRALIFKLKRKIVEPLFKLEYQVSYFKKLINVCSPVINMSKGQYLKFINNKQKENIKSRIELLRK